MVVALNASTNRCVLSATKALLKTLNVQPKRSLGQHFLVQSTIAQRSIAWASIKPQSVVVEIGAGCGILTQQLVHAGARVFVVEKERAFAEYIAQTFPVDVLCADACDFPVGHFDLSEPYRIVANLPYAIASIWLNRILELSRLPKRMVLLIQKETACRWLAPAGTKHFCALGINLQAAYEMEQSCPVAKGCFYPQPKVDSTLIDLRQRPNGFVFPQAVKQWIRQVFIHRRQQITRVCKRQSDGLSQAFLRFLEQNQVSPTIRAEGIPLDLWIAFARNLTTPPNGQ